MCVFHRLPVLTGFKLDKSAAVSCSSFRKHQHLAKKWKKQVKQDYFMTVLMGSLPAVGMYR